MNSAAEIARIKAERVALQETFAAAVRERLKQGPATSAELGKILKAGPFSPFWGWLRKSQTFAIRVGKRAGEKGHPNIVWALPPRQAAK